MAGPAQRRFGLSALLALPVTVALLLFMTMLILPGEQDPVVRRMIQDIEFLRTEPQPEEIEVYALPAPPEPPDPPEAEASERPVRPAIDRSLDEDVPADSPVRVIDWWAEVRSLTEEADEEALKRWLLEQGFEKYVSIMQGPLPITNPVRAGPQETQGDRTGYLNIYGDLEFKISENCVLQTLVSSRLDVSDFAQKLPMRVMCKPRLKTTYDFERD